MMKKPPGGGMFSYLLPYPTLKPHWLYSHDQHRLLPSSAALGHRHPVMTMWLHAGRDMAAAGGVTGVGGEVCSRWGGGSWVRRGFEGAVVVVVVVVVVG